MKQPSYTAEENRVLSHSGWAAEPGTPIAVCTGTSEYAHGMAELIADALNKLEASDINRMRFTAKCARYALVNSGELKREILRRYDRMFGPASE